MSVCFHRLWQEELNKLENQTKKFSKCEAVKKKRFSLFIGIITNGALEVRKGLI